MKTRTIEMYIGTGDDSGTWGTEYVDIPIDTPEDKIEEAGKDAVIAEGIPFTICGIYAIPPLDEFPNCTNHLQSCDDDGFCNECGEQD